MDPLARALGVATGMRSLCDKSSCGLGSSTLSAPAPGATSRAFFPASPQVRAIPVCPSVESRNSSRRILRGVQCCCCALRLRLPAAPSIARLLLEITRSALDAPAGERRLFCRTFCSMLPCKAVPRWQRPSRLRRHDQCFDDVHQLSRVPG